MSPFYGSQVTLTITVMIIVAMVVLVLRAGRLATLKARMRRYHAVSQEEDDVSADVAEPAAIDKKSSQPTVKH